MNLSTAKNTVLMLIDTYSKNGTIQDPNGTKLKNYAYKMPKYFDIAQKQVATIKKIEKIHPVDTVPDTSTAFYEIMLPENCFKMNYVESNYVKIAWKRRGKDKIVVSADTLLPIDIFYYAYPTTIDANTPDSYEFEVDIDAQEALPFFVAAQLLLSENNSVGDRLLATYSNMLANLDIGTPTSTDTVVNGLFTGNSSNKLF